MGLENFEIVLQAEEAFGIAISDEAAECMRTPADLVAFVLSKVPVARAPECMSQRMFYRLRKGFRIQVPALLTKFKPDTQLSTILHKDQWRRVWSGVRDSVGEPQWPAVVPWPGLFRAGPRTIGQLVWHIVAMLPKPDVTAGESWDRTRVEGEVRRILKDVLGEQEYRLNASFVDDLGVG